MSKADQAEIVAQCFSDIAKMRDEILFRKTWEDGLRIFDLTAKVMSSARGVLDVAAVNGERCSAFRKLAEAVGLHPWGSGIGDQAISDALDELDYIQSRLAGSTKTSPAKRRKRTRQPTPPQVEAMMVVGQCGKNFAEAGRLLKKDPKTVRDLYNAGLKNAGRLAPMLIGKPKTRHGIEIASGDVGASPSHAGKTKINREHR